MPTRPGLDDDPELEALIRLWVEGSQDLDRRIAAVYADILREFRSDVPDTFIIRRLRLQAARLETLADVAEATVRRLAGATRQWIDIGGVSKIYVAGAVVVEFPFTFALPHREAVKVLADDLFSDVLAATEFVSADSKRWVRRVSRKLTGFKLTGGVPVKTQAKRFEREIKREFLRRGMGSVRYSDGRRVSFGTYSEMLLRTKTGMAYNAGTLNHSKRSGVTVVELFDGPECGLTSHNDGELAHGMIVPIEIAAAYPLAHPNCRRAVGARPDLSVLSPEVASPALPEESRTGSKFNEAIRVGGRTAQERARAERRRNRRRNARPVRV